MKAHMFGNSPSAVVSICGLRKMAQEGKKEFGSDVRQFVESDFYVDDGLKSLSTEKDVISLLSRTQKMLPASNIRLHKIALNYTAVLEAFQEEDRAKDIDLCHGASPSSAVWEFLGT